MINVCLCRLYLATIVHGFEVGAERMQYFTRQDGKRVTQRELRRHHQINRLIGKSAQKTPMGGIFVEEVFLFCRHQVTSVTGVRFCHPGIGCDHGLSACYPVGSHFVQQGQGACFRYPVVQQADAVMKMFQRFPKGI